MIKRSFVFFAVAILCFSLYGCIKPSETKETYKIAVIAPLTGPYKILGKSIVNGTELAVHEANKQNGINGKKIELIIEDDGGLVGEGAFFAYRLTRTQMLLGVIGHLNSDISIPASEFYARAMIVEISPGSTSPYFTERNSTKGYVFRTIGRDDTQGKLAAKYVLKKGLKRVVVLYNDRAYGEELAGEFSNSLKSLPGYNVRPEVVYYGMIDVGKKNFGGLLEQLKSKNPDVIFLAGEHDDAGYLVQDFEKHGLGMVQFIGGDGIDHQDFIDIGKKGAEGAITISSPIIKDESFIEKYKEKYIESPTGYAANAYDATNILINAIKNVKSLDTTLIAKEVSKTKDFPGVTGTISFDSKGDLTTSGFVLRKVVNGKFEALEED